ncbi:MAG: hypothetical protein BRC33_13730 [Cyanobacteria bacterium SW_9_44_58]|nr:MAG: hypothetical protein BRC33_13730 [Cyanobacteria bacterium SW_9_44_58]
MLTFLERLIAPLDNGSIIAEDAPYIQGLKTLGFTAPFYKVTAEEQHSIKRKQKIFVWKARSEVLV